jgi:hypothetical protein
MRRDGAEHERVALAASHAERGGCFTIDRVRFDLGDVPTWVASVGALAAFAVSFRLLSRDTSDRRVAAAALVARQAQLVAGWVHEQRFQGDGLPEILVRVRNGSDLPIYYVELSIAAGGRGTFVRHTPAMGPGEIREYVVILPAPPRNEIWAPNIQFTDSTNQRWLRRSGGELSRWLPGDAHFEEHAGAYESAERHPTLRLPEDRQLRAGTVVRT